MIPLPQKSDSGRIINISSGMGALRNMGGGDVAYRVSKTALNSITAVMAADLSGTNIKSKHELTGESVESSAAPLLSLRPRHESLNPVLGGECGVRWRSVLGGGSPRLVVAMTVAKRVWHYSRPARAKSINCLILRSRFF